MSDCQPGPAVSVPSGWFNWEISSQNFISVVAIKRKCHVILLNDFQIKKLCGFV